MKSIRQKTPGSVVAVVFFAAVLAVSAGAAAQDGAPPLLDAGEVARHEAEVPQTGPRHRPFVVTLNAVPLLTYVGSAGPRGSEIVTPGERFAATQLVGAGYVVNPRFRFGLIAIFSEAFSGLPANADAWQFGGVAPVAIGTLGKFVIGGGPIVGYRSGGTRRTDIGAVMLTGASLPLGKGVALNIVAPLSALFGERTTVSIGAAVGVAKVF